MVTKFTERVLISGAAVLAIIGAMSGVGLLGEAHAAPTPCVNATGQCQPQMTNGPVRPNTIICQSAGPKGGASCHELRAADRR